jgi:hypothetical protein
MCRLDAVAVGKHDEDAVGDGLEVGAWAVHAEEVRGIVGVGNSRVFGVRRDRWGESYRIKANRCGGRIGFNFIVLGWLSFRERLGRSAHFVFFGRLVFVVPALGAALRPLVPDLAAMGVAVVGSGCAGTRVGVVRGAVVGIVSLAVAFGQPVEFGVCLREFGRELADGLGEGGNGGAVGGSGDGQVGNGFGCFEL